MNRICPTRSVVPLAAVALLLAAAPGRAQYPGGYRPPGAYPPNNRIGLAPANAYQPGVTTAGGFHAGTGVRGTVPYGYVPNYSGRGTGHSPLRNYAYSPNYSYGYVPRYNLGYYPGNFGVYTPGYVPGLYGSPYYPTYNYTSAPDNYSYYSYAPGSYSTYNYWPDYYLHAYSLLDSLNAANAAGRYQPVYPSTDAPEAPAPPPTGEARLDVRVPAGAELWVEGKRMSQTGEYRQFVSPPLEPGKDYAYRMRVRWIENGREVERTRDVVVRPGDQLDVDLTRPDVRMPPAER
jgi:uncharacterized protein (TIGR03000 family)